MATRQVQFSDPGAQRVQIEGSLQQAPSPIQQVRGAVIGGGVMQAPAARTPRFDRASAQVDTSTITALQRMGDAVVGAAVERRQQEMYVEGARRQIEGEALADIVREQPWYSRIFGPSASVQGARTMAQITEVERFSETIHSEMGNLRRLSPDEFQAEFMDRLRNTTVGDSTADAAIQASILENYGPIVRNHTSEHTAYVQEQMQEQFTGALMAQGRTMYRASQGLVSRTMSETDYNAVLANTEAALHPLEGQTAESYWSAIDAASQEAMALGNFHFVNVVEQTLYEHMPAEQRVEFLENRRRFENRTIEDLSAGPMSVDIANVRAYSAEGQVDAATTWENIQELNRRFRAQTGIQRDLLDGSAAESIITNNIRGVIQEQKQFAREARDRAAQEQAQFAQVQAARTSFLTGSLGSYIAQGGDRQTAQAVAADTVAQIEAAGGDWGSLVAEQANRDGTVITPLANSMQYGVRASIGGEYSPAFEQTYQRWLQLYQAPGGEAAAAAYLGDDYGGLMENYHLDRLASNDPAGSFTRNVSVAPVRRRGSTETANEVEEWLSENVTNPGWWSRTFGTAVPMHHTSAHLLATRVADHVDTMDLPLSTDQKAARGLALVRQSMDFVGEFAYDRAPQQARVSDLLATDETTAAMVFRRDLQSKATAAGLDLDDADTDVIITRHGGNTNAAWTAHVYQEGRAVPIHITLPELESWLGRGEPEPRVDLIPPIL